MIVRGSWCCAREMADSTSLAASPRFSSRSNCSAILVEPWVLDEVISSMPGMMANDDSSGVAIVEAMVTGSAPARDAFT